MIVSNYPDDIANWSFLESRRESLNCSECGSDYNVLVHDELEKQMIRGFTCHDCLHYNGDISDERHKELEKINKIKLEVF